MLPVYITHWPTLELLEILFEVIQMCFGSVGHLLVILCSSVTLYKNFPSGKTMTCWSPSCFLRLWVLQLTVYICIKFVPLRRIMSQWNAPRWMDNDQMVQHASFIPYHHPSNISTSEFCRHAFDKGRWNQASLIHFCSPSGYGLTWLQKWYPLLPPTNTFPPILVPLICYDMRVNLSLLLGVMGHWWRRILC